MSGLLEFAKSTLSWMSRQLKSNWQSLSPVGHYLNELHSLMELDSSCSLYSSSDDTASSTSA